MANSWRGRLSGHVQPPPPFPTETPSWRYRLLLLAIGSCTADGSDVTAHDRSMLLKMDQHLIQRAAVLGDAAAHTALIALVEILRGEDRDPSPQLH